VLVELDLLGTQELAERLATQETLGLVGVVVLQLFPPKQDRVVMGV